MDMPISGNSDKWTPYVALLCVFLIDILIGVVYGVVTGDTLFPSLIILLELIAIPIILIIVFSSLHIIKYFKKKR